MTENADDLLAFTVATVWRDQRVSCPHPDILRAFDVGSLESGAMEFVRFHLDESQCPYCNATLADLRVGDKEAAEPVLRELKDRLMRSTRAALRQVQKP